MLNLLIILFVNLMPFFQLTNAATYYLSAPGYYEAKYTTTVPVIDGNGNDTCWNKADWAPIDQIWIGNAVTETDFSGKFRVLWTKDRLYVLVRIVDDSLQLQSPGVTSVCNNIYNYDCVEIFIDENRSRDVNYSGTFNSFAYHLDTAGHVCYAVGGSIGWVRLDDHINYRMKRVDTHTFDYEYEIKVFNDTYVNGGNNSPVGLTNGKLMGWSVAYNDNDNGTSRQNMIGSIFIEGTDKNVSYYNSSVFGELKLVGGDSPTTDTSPIMRDSNGLNVRTNGEKLQVTYSSDKTDVEINFQLFDIRGRQVLNLTAFKSGISIDKEMNISGLSKGIYMVKVSEQGKSETEKIVLN
jgi:hypothetical protein